MHRVGAYRNLHYELLERGKQADSLVDEALHHRPQVEEICDFFQVNSPEVQLNLLGSFGVFFGATAMSTDLIKTPQISA